MAVNRLRCAFSFLTRIPAGTCRLDAPGALSGSVLFYFVVAFFVGALCGVVAWLVSLLNVAYFAALIWVVTEAVITGGLHIDGFADVCDAFLCSTSRTRRLEILKDSRHGTFGVIGIAFDIGAKLILIGALPDTFTTYITLCAVPVAGKAGLIACAAFSRPARSDGLGHALLSDLKLSLSISSFSFCAVIVLLLLCWLQGTLVLAGSFVCGLAMKAAAEKEIGGTTGDVLGAANELSEIIALVLIVAAHHLAL